MIDPKAGTYVAGLAAQWAAGDRAQRWIHQAPDAPMAAEDFTAYTIDPETISDYLAGHNPFPDGTVVEVAIRADTKDWKSVDVEQWGASRDPRARRLRRMARGVPQRRAGLPRHQRATRKGKPMTETTTTMPMVEAMDLFDRFWNARTDGDDWTVIGVGCECGNCKECGISYALSWTNALLSNPDLAAHAERLAHAKRLRDPATNVGGHSKNQTEPTQPQPAREDTRA